MHRVHDGRATRRSPVELCLRLNQLRDRGIPARKPGLGRGLGHGRSVCPFRRCVIFALPAARQAAQRAATARRAWAFRSS